MIKIFEQMFGDTFWKQCVLVFTRMPMNDVEKGRRKKSSKKSDDVFAKDYIAEVEKKFPKSSGGLRHLFLDACFDEEDKSEEDSFNASMEALYNMLQAASPLQTSEVKENVQTEQAKFRKAYDEQLKNMEKEHNKKLE